MVRDVIAFGFFDDSTQSRVGVRVGHPILGRHVELSAVLRKELGFLSGSFENRSFALLKDSSHGNSALFVFR